MSFLAANLHIFSLYMALTLNKTFDVSPHEEQSTALCHLEKLRVLLFSYSKTTY